LKQNNHRLKSKKRNLKMKGRKNLMKDRIQQVLLLSFSGAELLSSEERLHIENENVNHEDDRTLKGMEQEIECPRCYDIMTLSSNFYRLGYSCQKR
jgi:hypothetical protein